MSVCAAACVPGCRTAETLQLLCVWPQELATPSESCDRHPPCTFRTVSFLHQPNYLSVRHRCSEPAAGFMALPQQPGRPHPTVCVSLSSVPAQQLATLLKLQQFLLFLFPHHLHCVFTMTARHCVCWYVYKACVWSCVCVYHVPDLSSVKQSHVLTFMHGLT